MGKDILFSDLLITRAGMLSTKCVTGEMVYVYRLVLVQIFCKLSYGWSSVSCSYSDAFLHTEFAVMGFFLLKYALHLGISHYAA
jgi:hypothetical protein